MVKISVLLRLKSRILQVKLEVMFSLRREGVDPGRTPTHWSPSLLLGKVKPSCMVNGGEPVGYNETGRRITFGLWLET